MNVISVFLRKKSLQTVALVVFVVGSLFLLQFFIRNEHEQFQTQQISETTQFSSALRAKIEQTMNEKIFLAHGLKTLVISRNYDTEELADEFYDYAKVLVSDNEVRSIQLQPDAIVKYVYPIEGNEQAIGHNLLVDDIRKDAVLRAIENNQAFITGPIDLLQGGSGMIARLPIYYNEDNYGLESFWGFATVLIDTDIIFEEIEAFIKNDKYVFALRGKDGLGANGDIFYGNAEIFRNNPILQDIIFLDGKWQLATLPKSGWKQIASAEIVIGVIGLLLIGILSIFFLLLLNEPRRLQERVDQATKNLQENKNLLEKIINNQPYGILVEDIKRNVLFVNNAFLQLFGIPSDSKALVGTSCTAALDAAKKLFKHPEEFRQSIEQLVKDQKEEFENKFDLVDGRTFYRSHVPVVFKGSNLGSMWVYQDITEKMKVEKMKSDFISLVSHQLKTPVAQIKGYVENMLSGVTGDLNLQQKRYLQDIIEISTTNLVLVEDLLNLSRIERGVLSSKKEQAHLSDVINQALSLFKEKSKEKNVPIQIKNKAETADILLVIDVNKTIQSLRNIIDNALNYSPSGSPIIVTIDEGPKNVTILITDVGPGIDENVAKEIFKREKVLTGKQGAHYQTGLGLYLAYNFIKIQGGTLQFQTEKGKGTTFSITFPKT